MKIVSVVCAVFATAIQLASASENCTVIDLYPAGLGVLRENIKGPCSQRGQCVNEVCVCNEGWNGRGDFLDTTGQDCQTGELPVSILWGINLFFQIFFLAKGAPLFWARWKQYQETKATKLAQGRKYSLWNNRGLIACLGFVFVCAPSMIAMAILRIVDTNERIGLTWGATILFALQKLGFYFAVWAFQPALLSTILKGKASTAYLVKINDIGSAILCTFAAAVGMLPLITLFASDGKDTIAMVVYYLVIGGTWLQLTLLFLQARYVKRKVSKALDASYETAPSQRIKDIKAGLVGIQRQNIIQTVVQGTFFMVLTLFPFMYNRHDYWLPASTIGYALVGFKLAKTTVRDTNASKTGGSTSNGGSKSYSKSDKSKNTEPQSFKASTQVGSFHYARSTNNTVDRFTENVTSFVEADGGFADADEEYV